MNALAVGAVALAIAIGGMFGYQYQNQNQGVVPGLEQEQSRSTVNRQNCLADDCLLVDDVDYPVDTLPASVQSALQRALEDEYAAQATYEAVIGEYGMVRPFSMIIGAEEQHIATLKVLFDKYGMAIPANPYTGTIAAPASLTAACETGVAAEIANASLYEDELLPAVEDYPDITQVFTSLMNASQDKHLPAFERCADGSVGTGAGVGTQGASAGSTSGAGQGRNGR